MTSTICTQPHSNFSGRIGAATPCTSRYGIPILINSPPTPTLNPPPTSTALVPIEALRCGGFLSRVRAYAGYHVGDTNLGDTNLGAAHVETGDEGLKL